jgi:trimeric autotransporter adhesin
MNSLIKFLISWPRMSANRTKSPRSRHSILILTTVALIFFALLSAYARTDVLQPFYSEDLGNGNSAAENVGALVSLTTGVDNTATGVQSLANNSAGSNNTATGFQSLFTNTAGDFNTATGSQALFSNTIGSWNTANGFLALYSNTTGTYNTAIGFQALLSNTTGSDNTATGTSALGSNTVGYVNTANGFEALGNNTTGAENTGVGHHALFANTTGDQNTANGINALVANTTGSANTANGVNSLYWNTIGRENTAVGTWALFSNGGSSSGNVALGFNAGSQLNNGSHNVYIGAGITGNAFENNACYIASIFGQTAVSGIPVLISANNRLGTATSSKRFKEEIRPMDHASEALLALKPVTFRYKKEIDPQGIPQFGLIAEEVEKVNPKLVVRDKEGKVNTVRYEAVNAMLLNEFLKEHKTVEEQQGTINALKKGIETLAAQLKEQAKQIQRVSAQIATSRPAPRIVTNR